MIRDWSYKSSIYAFSVLFVMAAVFSCVMGLNTRIFYLNENQILYIYSTSAQVIAGIYGLTLTGFIFYRNELSREEFEDETLAEAIQELELRYSTLLVFVTILVGITLLLSDLAIATEGSGSTVETTVLLNSGQCAFAASLLAIAFFIFDVTNPRRLQLASSRLKEQLDPRQNAKEPGSLEQFLKNYNEIEYLLSDFGEANRYTPASAQGPRNSRPTSSARLAEILLRNEKINKGLFFQLKRLITLRNSIIHGADPALSSDVIKASEDLIFRLKLVLGPSGHQFHAR